jgi:hypothetical protein
MEPERMEVLVAFSVVEMMILGAALSLSVGGS